MAEIRVAVPYQVCTLIELPPAALFWSGITESTEFLLLGTKDLTPTALGISRDDAASFLGPHTATGTVPAGPFITIDAEDMAELVSLAAGRGRATKPGVKFGTCGEHGGDPASVALCEGIGLDHVSCSPFRTPFAASPLFDERVEAEGRTISQCPLSKCAETSD